MAFLLSKASPFSRFQIHSQPNKTEDTFLLSRRRFHLELGAREKAQGNVDVVLNDFKELLEEDPALKKFKSYKKSVWRLKRVGDVLTIIVVAGCCYEIYVKTVMKKAAVEEAKAKNSGA